MIAAEHGLGSLTGDREVLCHGHLSHIENWTCMAAAARHRMRKIWLREHRNIVSFGLGVRRLNRTKRLSGRV